MTTTSNVLPLSLDARISARLDDLSPAEVRVAEFFTAHREEGAFESAIEIANRIGVSDATVIRAVQKLGYSGLPDLKRELIQELRSRLTPAARLGHSLEWMGEGPSAILEHVLTLQIEFLEEARNTVRPEALGKAAELIAAADHVVCFGIGPLASLAQYLALRLARFGSRTSTIDQTGFRLADGLLSMQPGDVLVMLAYGRVYLEVGVTLARARELGIPVVLITDTLEEAAANMADAIIAARCTRAGMLSTVATTFVLTEALTLVVASLDRSGALRAMDDLNHLRARLIGDEENRHRLRPQPYESF